jgi:acyl-coenzyme A thioesterase PaaI-like protein
MTNRYFLPSAWNGPSTTHGGPQYGEMIETLRTFQAILAGARPEAETIAQLTAVLKEWSCRLEQDAATEDQQVYARRADLAGRGQATWPAVIFDAADDNSLAGTVRFSRFYLGRNGNVHGGAVALLFDDMAGRVVHLAGRPVSRTAYLRTDFRAPVPIDADLRIAAAILREEGRKRFVHVELRDGETLCAEAEGLMVAARDDG